MLSSLAGVFSRRSPLFSRDLTLYYKSEEKEKLLVAKKAS
jgi:hypothetical protein